MPASFNKILNKIKFDFHKCYDIISLEVSRMFIIYMLFMILCCYITYKVTCYQIIKLNNINLKGFETQCDYIGKSFDEISKMKQDINKIKKDIYQ